MLQSTGTPGCNLNVTRCWYKGASATLHRTPGTAGGRDVTRRDYSRVVEADNHMVDYIPV